MLNIKTSLDEISHEYTVFEANQVLTHDQLNGVVDYLVDQDRLTRVDLAGVGIYCGLRATLDLDRVRLTRGVGVTTDGDLARVPADREYTHYRRYSESAPRYEKLIVNGSPLATWELLPATTTDPAAAPLTGFAAAEGVPLSTLAALILIESIDIDNDICSETNCDSRGERATETLRLLLLDATDAASIAGAPATPAAAAPLLDEISIDRPLMAGVTTIGGLVGRYRAACDAIQAKLAAALPKLHARAGAFLWEADPTPGWLQALAALQASFASSGFGIQYYYDHLRDLVETYTKLRERLSGDSAVCVPDVDAFPKHLVLGRIVPGSGADARIGCYPSPIVRGAVDRLGHARFLAGKLGVLISAWQLPSPGGPIRITPSLFGDRGLEERAIPYYYDPGHTPAVHESWSFELSQRGMGRYNLAYHAPGSWGLGDAASPLTSSLGRFTFFRVEGQLGRKVDDAVASLESTIRQHDLPITLATGLLRATQPQPLTIATELREAHDALRAQLASQIDQVVVFARRAISRLGDDLVHQDAAALARPAVEELEEQAAEAKAGLAPTHDDPDAESGWRAAAEAAILRAADLRAQLGPLMTRLEAAPFEALSKSTALADLDLLRNGILDEEQGSTRPLFVSHLEQQPGLDHFAGASRGATLLLVYDEDEHVIADFMLPCCNCEVLSEADKNAGGAREVVSAVYARSGLLFEHPVPRGSELSVDRLADGLRLVPESDIGLGSVTEADCTVTLELPYPPDGDDLWTPSAPGFQAVGLHGSVTQTAGDLIWKPIAPAAAWLRDTLAEALGPPELDFYTSLNQPTTSWSHGPQHQLICDNVSSLLVPNMAWTGDAAVYQLATSRDEIFMRAHWPAPLAPSHHIQTGLVYEHQHHDIFWILLYEARAKSVFHSGFEFLEVTSSISRVLISYGTAIFSAPEHVQTRVFNETSIHHPPLEIRLGPGGLRVSEISNTGFFDTYHDPAFLSHLVSWRFGAFTTVPVEIWELSDGVQSLQPALSPRVRARLHLDRRAATWAGPAGMTRPFIPDFETWFWVYESAPAPPGSGSPGPTPLGPDARDAHDGIGTELIR